MFNKDYERLIGDYRQKIEELEAQRRSDENRLQGLQHLDGHMADFYNKYNLNEKDLFLYKADAIVKWVKSLESQEMRPSFFNDLQQFFARADKKRRPSAAAKNTGPKLEVGLYRNPNDGQQVKKVKRNPRELDQWIEQYGLDVVQSWKQ